MNQDEYQLGFFANNEAYQDAFARQRKANTILKVLGEVVGGTKNLTVVDFGCSSGFVADHLAEYCEQVIGLDIDTDAIQFAKKNLDKKNLEFRVIQGVDSSLRDESVDVVVCNHVYEHVPDPKKLLDEIYRVLKPNGICYFSAGNRWQFMEPHYQLYFLSWMPKALAHRYLKLRKRGDFYYETHLTLPALKRLVASASFSIEDYTRRLIRQPDRYGMGYILPPQSLLHRAASALSAPLYYIIPTYIWVLKKD